MKGRSKVMSVGMTVALAVLAGGAAMSVSQRSGSRIRVVPVRYDYLRR